MVTCSLPPPSCYSFPAHSLLLFSLAWLRIERFALFPLPSLLLTCILSPHRASPSSSSSSSSSSSCYCSPSRSAKPKCLRLPLSASSLGCSPISFPCTMHNPLKHRSIPSSFSLLPLFHGALFPSTPFCIRS